MSDSESDSDGETTPKVAADDDFAKAMQLSKLEAEKSPPKQEDYFDDDELRRALELSHQACSAQAPTADSDSDFERMLAESAAEFEKMEEHRAEYAQNQEKEKEFLKESERMAAEHEKALKERLKQQKEDYSKQLTKVKYDNQKETENKEKRRKEFYEQQAARQKELDAMAAKEAETQRLREQAIRELRLQPVVPDSEMSREEQEQMRQACIASLGDDENKQDKDENLADVDVPTYREKKGENEKKPRPAKYTTTSRDPTNAGVVCEITDAIWEEFIEKICDRARLIREQEEDPNDKFPKYHKDTKEDPSSVEGNAVGAKPDKEEPKGKPAWDSAKAMHGGTRQAVRTAAEVRAGRALPQLQGGSRQQVAENNQEFANAQGMKINVTARPWMTRFAGVQDRIDNASRSKSKAPRSRA